MCHSVRDVLVLAFGHVYEQMQEACQRHPMCWSIYAVMPSSNVDPCGFNIRLIDINSTCETLQYHQSQAVLRTAIDLLPQDLHVQGSAGRLLLEDLVIPEEEHKAFYTLTKKPAFKWLDLGVSLSREVVEVSASRCLPCIRRVCQ